MEIRKVVSSIFSTFLHWVHTMATITQEAIKNSPELQEALKAKLPKIGPIGSKSIKVNLNSELDLKEGMQVDPTSLKMPNVASRPVKVDQESPLGQRIASFFESMKPEIMKAMSLAGHTKLGKGVAGTLVISAAALSMLASPAQAGPITLSDITSFGAAAFQGASGTVAQVGTAAGAGLVRFDSNFNILDSWVGAGSSAGGLSPNGQFAVFNFPSVTTGIDAVLMSALTYGVFTTHNGFLSFAVDNNGNACGSNGGGACISPQGSVTQYNNAGTIYATNADGTIVAGDDNANGVIYPGGPTGFGGAVSSFAGNYSVTNGADGANLSGPGLSEFVANMWVTQMFANSSAIGINRSTGAVMARNTAGQWNSAQALLGTPKPVSSLFVLYNSGNGQLINFLVDDAMVKVTGDYLNINAEHNNVPEPGTFALLGLGVAAYGIRRWGVSEAISALTGLMSTGASAHPVAAVGVLFAAPAAEAVVEGAKRRRASGNREAIQDLENFGISRLEY